MNINLELYKVFCEVAKSGSITKAANGLFISQPAVSQSIKQLEQQIGGRLFMRTSKGMDLTYEGKIVYEYISQASVLIDMAEKKFSQMKKLSTGEISIGAGDAFCRYYLLKFINVYRKNYPGINIRITNRTSKETVNLLCQGKVDIGFVNTPQTSEFLNMEKCFEIEDCFVCDKEVYDSIKNPLSIEDICQQPLILLEKLSNTRKSLDVFFEEKGQTLTPILELGSVDLIVDMVKCGMGVGYCSKDVVKKELETGELYIVPLAFDLPKRDMCAVTLKGVPLNFAGSEFLNLILKGNSVK